MWVYGWKVPIRQSEWRILLADWVVFIVCWFCCQNANWKVKQPMSRLSSSFFFTLFRRLSQQMKEEHEDHPRSLCYPFCWTGQLIPGTWKHIELTSGETGSPVLSLLHRPLSGLIFWFSRFTLQKLTGCNLQVKIDSEIPHFIKSKLEKDRNFLHRVV